MDTSQLEKFIEFPIDFKGQQLVERISYVLITFGFIISLFFGFALQDITYSFYAFIPLVLLSIIIVLPSYPAYNKNPTVFLKRPVSKPINIEIN